MIVGINKRRFSVFIIFITAIVAVTAGYKPIMKKYFYPKQYDELIVPLAERYSVDENLIYSIIKAESGFDESAVSHAGAKGLMQITDNTAKWILEKLGISLESSEDIFAPEINILLGTWYIAKLIEDNGGNIVTALASYNAGSANVQKWQKNAGTDDIKPEDMEFKETENYVNKTLEYYEIYSKLWS